MRTRRHKLPTFVLAMLLIGFLGSYLVRLHPGQESLDGTGGPRSLFLSLTGKDGQRLAAQRSVVLREAQRRYGTPRFFRDERDFAVLQKLIDEQAFRTSQTYELQSLGVVLGDVFDARPEFGWVVISDEYGRDSTLRYKNTTARVNALTMISKRIEKAEAVDVSELFSETLRLLEEHEAEFGG